MAQSGQQISERHVHHGNSVAAWGLVVVMTVGSLMVAVAVAAKSMMLGILGTVVIVAGVVVGKVLQAAGYGIKSDKSH